MVTANFKEIANFPRYNTYVLLDEHTKYKDSEKNENELKIQM